MNDLKNSLKNEGFQGGRDLYGQRSLKLLEFFPAKTGDFSLITLIAIGLDIFNYLNLKGYNTI